MTGEGGPRPPMRRAGEIWTDEEHRQLVEWLREGVALDQIAEWLGRGVAAVRARMRMLVTPGAVLAPGGGGRPARSRSRVRLAARPAGRSRAGGPVLLVAGTVGRAAHRLGTPADDGR